MESIRRGTWETDICSEGQDPVTRYSAVNGSILLAHPSSFSSVVKGWITTTHPSETHATRDQTETDEEPATANEALFTCPEEGCSKTFLRHSYMM